VVSMTKRQKRKTAEKGLNRKLLYGVVLATLITLAALVTYYLFFQPHTENWAAAIIDQVTIKSDLFNKDFNDTATSIFNVSGFDVKYYPSDDVTVDFYKDLPSKGGKIIILRVHSSVRNESDFVDLFTSELHNKEKEIRYSAEYGNQLSVAEFLITGDRYFAIGPTFVNFSVRGRFDSSCVVVLMGCDSLNKTSMAEALIGRGAKVVIGWTRSVELEETDESTLDLLQCLLAEDPYTIQGAVKKVNETSHYPYRTSLDYYPKKAGSYVVPTRENETSLYLMKVSFQVLLLVTLAKWKRDSVDVF